MKKLLVLSLLFISSTAYAEKVRVYQDYTPVRICVDSDTEAGKSGLTGNFKVMDRSEIPPKTEYRNAWKMDSGAIKVDSNLKSDIDAKKQKKNDLILKLKEMGLSDEQAKQLARRE